MDQEVVVLQQELNHLIEKSGFLGGLIASQEGLVILASEQKDPSIEIDNLAANAASIFNENSMYSDSAEEVMISYPNRKVFIQKLLLPEDISNILLFILIVPNHLRYFRRSANKVAKYSLNLVSCL